MGAATRIDAADELEDFAAGRLPPGRFGHRDHVRLAHGMLARHGFEGALARYAAGLRAATRAAGAPEKFNLTVTIAFLALIGERMEAAPGEGWEAFERANPDLMDPACLTRWYGRDRLSSPAARRTFLLPEPARS